MSGARQTTPHSVEVGSPREGDDCAYCPRPLETTSVQLRFADGRRAWSHPECWREQGDRAPHD